MYKHKKITIKTKLYKHQFDLLKFHLSKSRTLDASEMGVGKTLVAIYKAVTLYNYGFIKDILVVCPKSVMETWCRELRKHSDFTYAKLEGSVDRKVETLYDKAYEVIIVSYDSLSERHKTKTSGILLNAVLNRRFGMVICDECTHIKSFKAARTEAVTKICDNARYTFFATGTPITNKVESVFTIYRAMDRGATFSRNFFAARNKYFIDCGYGFPVWELRESMKEEFHKRLYDRAIRLRKDECMNLPNKIFAERFVNMTPEQLNIYNTIAQSILDTLILEEGKMKVKNPMVKLSKLSQITSGFVYTDDKTKRFDSNPKLDAISDILSETPESEKIIIFTKWREDIDILTEFLDKLNIGYVWMDGTTKDRGEVLSDFENFNNCRVLVSQIQVGAFGLNLQFASNVIYYDLDFSLISWLQSQDRIHRRGQKKKCVYSVIMCNNSIDEYIYQSLQRGVDLSKSILDKDSVFRLKTTLEATLENK
jgi:SNF2 family DNA or RNA helicase